MDAVGLDDEESKKALQIKQSWPDLVEKARSCAHSGRLFLGCAVVRRVKVIYADKGIGLMLLLRVEGSMGRSWCYRHRLIA
eukprot:COSAG01_NODE_5395_length_4290_cov_5.110475_4_plen_81_part_00